MSDFAHFEHSAYIDEITRDIGHGNNSNSDAPVISDLQRARSTLQRTRAATAKIQILPLSRPVNCSRKNERPPLEDSSDFRSIRREISREFSAIFPITVHSELEKVFRGKRVAFIIAAS